MELKKTLLCTKKHPAEIEKAFVVVVVFF